jgi:hypothetical protein
VNGNEQKKVCAFMEKEYAVGWGTLALINAGLAQTKNQSGLLWFFLSLLLGPIATFMIVVLVKVPKDEH